MKNRIISYSKLSGEVRKAFRNWLEMNPSNLISFPWKGKDTKGYIFNHEQNQYLVVMPTDFSTEDFSEQNFIDFEDIDFNSLQAGA